MISTTRSMVLLSWALPSRVRVLWGEARRRGALWVLEKLVVKMAMKSVSGGDGGGGLEW